VLVVLHSKVIVGEKDLQPKKELAGGAENGASLET